VTVAQLRGRIASYATVVYNAFAILGTRLIGAVVGFVFWWLAARHFSQETIGFTGAALSSMEVVYRVSAMGIGTLLVSELHRIPTARRVLILNGVLVTGGAGVLLGGVAALVAPVFLVTLAPLTADAPVGTVLFALGSAVATIALTIDEVLIGLLRPALQIVRGVTAAVVRVLVVVLAMQLFQLRHPLTLVAAWVLGDVLSLLLVYLLARKQAQESVDSVAMGDRTTVTALLRKALPHHALNLVLSASGLLLPIAALAVLTAKDYAVFYLAWINDALAFTIPYAFVAVLYAVGNAEPHALRAKLRQVLGFGMLSAVLTTAVFWLAADPVLRAFGRQAEYADAATVLRLSVAALVPVLIKGLFVTLRRIEGRLMETMWLMVGIAVVEIALPVMCGLVTGLFGFMAGWLAGQFVIGLAMLPNVLRVARHGQIRAPRQTT
jgi:O-antigen/teichoic acid export membrane protein